MNLMSDLGHAIVVRRTILKMTQVELARRIGVARSYISLLENGERPLTDDLLQRISACLLYTSRQGQAVNKRA